MDNAMTELEKHNLLHEKVLFSLEQLSSKIDLMSFGNLLMWAFEFADDLNLGIDSKNLARCYFDRLLIAFQKLSNDQYILLMIVCLSLAARFYECLEVSCRASISLMTEQLQQKLTSDEIMELEQSVLEALEWRMCFTSPDDYLQVFLHRFPYEIKVFRDNLPQLIELAILHPRACEFTSEEIFYGAVLMTIKTSGMHLNQKMKIELKQATKCWERAKQVKPLITQIYREGQENQNDL